ncbi:DUF6235 family protein [Actinophytocola oryzae]|uniref:Uncharacterized protein n=1 Tax=Actinophytocola oryzae TaxID=502181 RepID=A0A4R7W513_9PSEU|nr:DUF6235 family protein [Actinophytocola oryzae]TDV57694.1 hypothetical protein CLV71_101567 [Actinophytocola oryzae]
MARRLRLGAGFDVLNAWTDAASDVDTKAVADALFAVVERSVYRAYPVIDDSTVARELVVVVRDDLALRLRLDDVEKFSIVFIGSPADALELHRGQAAGAS